MSQRKIADCRTEFHRFGRIEAPGLASPMYAELAYGVSSDDDLLALAAHAQRYQPAPNMLFAAVQYLLLQGIEHPLSAHYPILSGRERPLAPAFPLFREFCLEQRERLVELIGTRRTQTNVVRRCTCLLPAFALVHRQAQAPLALIDLGASAGLNLNFDRYAYRYQQAGREVLRWGPAPSTVELEADLRGPGALPPLPHAIPVAIREGVDLDPIDVTNADQLLWLRALIWPEHVERHRLLLDAAAELGKSPVRVHPGDAAEMLPGLLEAIPADCAPLVYSTIALYQFPRESRRRVADTLARASRARPVWQVALEGADPELTLARYADGSGDTERLARASPHGWWIEWRNGDG